MDTSKKILYLAKPSLTSLSGGFLLRKYQNGIEIAYVDLFFKKLACIFAIQENFITKFNNFKILEYGADKQNF